MIDTIVLTLTKDLFHINDPDAFKPSAQWINAPHHKNYSNIQSKQNPTKKDLINGNYKPRLTLANVINLRGKYEPLLRIELSLPKLVYGNNFYELQYKDFKQVTERLAAILATMGVVIDVTTLAHAPVSAIHYAKNIPLTDGSTPYHYIQKIKEAQTHASLDVNQTDYRNEGHSYRWHCNSYEVVFYDKIRDLEQAKQSNKRALEKDNDIQLHLLKKFKSRKNLEFLRMEVRLNKRAKMKQLFYKLNIKADLTFKKLFKPAIAKKVLLHYLDEIESKRAPILNFKHVDDKEFLADLAFNNPDIKPKQALLLFGIKKALEVATLRELQNIFTKSDKQGWTRFTKDMQLMELPTQDLPFKAIKESLEKFKPVMPKSIDI